MSRVLFVSFCILSAFPTSAKAANDGSGLQTSAAVDIVGQSGFQPNSGSNDRLTVRGAEVMFYSPADHMFDGSLSFAAHDDGGRTRLDLHEAMVGSTKLIPRSRFRIGQFFLGIGRLNQFHQHDWPFITAPQVHQTFFAKEGVLDTGIEYTYLFPTPFFLELTGGVTNGYIFGHDHSAGTRPAVPTHYVRLVTYASLPWDGGTQIGLNYVGRKDSQQNHTTMLGLDLTAKWRAATVTQMLLQSEFWYQIVVQPASATTNKMGFYLYPQYYLGENFFAGLRFDYFNNMSLRDAINIPLRDIDINFVPTITYRSSEFAQFRVAYNHGYDFGEGTVAHKSFLELQAIIILGAHPAHDF